MNEQLIRKLIGALELCVEGMKKSQDNGCTDHLDCWDGASVFWYGAIDGGERVAAEARKALDGFSSATDFNDRFFPMVPKDPTKPEATA